MAVYTHISEDEAKRYLAGFDLTVAAMADLDALEQVAFEAAEDARLQGAVLAEFRLAPLLFESHQLNPDAVVEATLAGLARSSLPSGLIVSAIRNHAPQQSMRSVQLALRWAGNGVVGFDLAGMERGYPASLHVEALQLARRSGLPITMHAGEADTAERVLEAGRLGATRIGHGVALAAALGDANGQAMIDEVLAMGLHLEVCPTSNIHTGIVDAMEQHPIAALRRAGISLSWHTDNTLMSRVNLSSEAAALLKSTTLDVDDLLSMARDAAQASFLSPAVRADALRQIAVATAQYHKEQ